MDSRYTVFKQIESDAQCPPAIKNELIAEIDLIRNSLTVVEVYVEDLFGVASAMLAALVSPAGQSEL